MRRAPWTPPPFGGGRGRGSIASLPVLLATLPDHRPGRRSLATRRWNAAADPVRTQVIIRTSFRRQAAATREIQVSPPTGDHYRIHALVKPGRRRCALTRSCDLIVYGACRDDTDLYCALGVVLEVPQPKVAGGACRGVTTTGRLGRGCRRAWLDLYRVSGRAVD